MVNRIDEIRLQVSDSRRPHLKSNIETGQIYYEFEFINNKNINVHLVYDCELFAVAVKFKMEKKTHFTVTSNYLPGLLIPYNKTSPYVNIYQAHASVNAYGYITTYYFIAHT